MSDAPLWTTRVVVQTLTYEDVPKAVEWLERVFGFRERADARLSWSGGGMTWIELEGGLVHVATPGHGTPSSRGAGRPGPRAQGLRRRRRRPLRAGEGRWRDDRLGARGRLLGRPHLPRAGSRGPSLRVLAA